MHKPRENDKKKLQRHHDTIILIAFLLTLIFAFATDSMNDESEHQAPPTGDNVGNVKLTTT